MVYKQKFISMFCSKNIHEMYLILFKKKILKHQLNKHTFNQTLSGFNPQPEPSINVIGYICGQNPLSKSRCHIHRHIEFTSNVDLERWGGGSYLLFLLLHPGPRVSRQCSLEEYSFQFMCSSSRVEDQTL